MEKLLVKVEESISDVMRQVERSERKEVGGWRLPESLQDAVERKKFIQEAIARCEEQQAKHLHPGEPEARLMKHGRTMLRQWLTRKRE